MLLLLAGVGSGGGKASPSAPMTRKQVWETASMEASTGCTTSGKVLSFACTPATSLALGVKHGHSSEYLAV